uniref:MIF4G domain-containing protein n=1 Tax=viral metagenome TaxID=1070528 RepID=A0A6C0LBL8_9ZZZZ
MTNCLSIIFFQFFILYKKIDINDISLYIIPLMLMQQRENNYVYNLNDFRDITFGGFDIKLPEETIAMITELAQQVGSPTYIKTPNFVKREQPANKDSFDRASADPNFRRKRRGNQGMEMVNDNDWESIRTFHATKMEQKVGIDAQFDMIRFCLNKITEKTYREQYEKIIEILDQLDANEEDMLKVGNAVFEIASNNRFYSKYYADLYTQLIHKYEIMKTVFENNLSSFLELFTKIEYVNADENYDLFCKINSDNERRKSLSTFFVNLSSTKIIADEKIIEFAANLLKQILEFIPQDNRKNEVDEMVENIAILYNKEIFSRSSYLMPNGQTIVEVIGCLANSKPKSFASLSNKAIFKFMDIVEM